jgi:hypothetical protein
VDRAQTRLLLAMSALVAVVAGVLYWQGEREEPRDPDATAQVWKLDAADVVKVEIAREDGRVVLEKQGDAWQVSGTSVGAELRDRADEDSVRTLLDMLEGAESGVPVDAPADRAADFGLGEPPETRVTVTLADGATKTLDVGAATPVGFRTYVRAADGSIAAIGGDAARALSGDPAFYRDRKVLRLDPAQVRSVRLEGPEGTLEVKGQGKDWWLTSSVPGPASGAGARADADKVDDLVVGLLDLRYDRVMADQHVAEPRFAVTIGLADGAERWLRVGEPGDMGVVVETDDGRAGVVYPALLDQLGRGPTDLAVRTAFQLRPDEADHVKIEGLATLDASRDGPDWTAPGVDPGKVADAVELLANVPIRWEREPPPAPEPVEGRVTVTEADRSWTIELGPVLDGVRSARDTAGGAPFRVPAEPLDQALGGLR